MTRIDQQIIFSALGFIAVAMREETNAQDSAKRARGMAWLIEEFCKTSVTEAFGETKDYSGDNLPDEQIDNLINTFKTTLRDEQEAKLPQDRATLLKMHRRLQERAEHKSRQRLPNDLLADLILEFIDAEIEEEG